MRRILITGVSGFLGWNLARSLRGEDELWGTYCRSPVEIEGCRMEQLDLLSDSGPGSLIKDARPDVVLHAAAMVDVDLCEKEREKAYAINVEGTRRVAAAAAEAGARLIYFSTDMVFDGVKGMYTEQDEPGPINWYGETKLTGERCAAGCCPDTLIFRLSLMYGIGSVVHGSFLAWMIRRLERGKPVSLFTDQFRTSLYVGDACTVVGRCIEHGDKAGVYHLAGSERMNRYEFGKRVAEVFGFPAELLRPVRMADLKNLLPRPEDNSMDNGKAKAELGARFRGATEGLREVAGQRGGSELRS